MSKASNPSRKERRAQRRRARRMRLQSGRQLRSSAPWATFVRGLAFVRKELVEIRRQPALLVVMIAGPFLLLLLFGLGYKNTSYNLRTEFVGPRGSVFEDAVTEYADQLDGYIDPQGFTTDENAARRRLADGDIDAVVVFPPDPLDDILAGHRATIRVLHDKLDPLQQTAIYVAARLAVQEVNSAVLGEIAGRAQSLLRPVDAVAAELTDQAAALSAAVADNDASAAATAADRAAETIAGARVVVATSADVIERLGGQQAAAASDEVVARLDTAAELAGRVSSGGGTELSADAQQLSDTLGEVAQALPSLATVDPDVLVRPFDSETGNIVPVDIKPADFFAPAAVVLLLQHLALSFAALSLVRDRELGLFELLRVGPLSSAEILGGKTIAYLLVGVGIGAALLAAAVYGLDVPFEGSVGWTAVAVVGVLLASLALGMVLSLVSGSETQAVQYAMLTLLASMFFSGFVLDVNDLVVPVRWVSYLLPATYGISMLRDVMLRGVSPEPADVIGVGALVLVYGLLAVGLLQHRLRTE